MADSVRLEEFEHRMHIFQCGFAQSPAFLRYLEGGYFDSPPWTRNWFCVPAGGQDPFKIARGNNGAESYNRLIMRVLMREKLQSLSNGIRLLRCPTIILESRINEIPLSVDYVSETTEMKRTWRHTASKGRQVSSGQVAVEAGFTHSDDELIIEAGNHPNRFGDG